MKLRCICLTDVDTGSRPARGAWIETGTAMITSLSPRSRPARGAWIETK